jgi:hypothetical protein
MLPRPPPKPIATCPVPQPRPRLTALRAVFNWVYMTRPAWVWQLPPRQQSDEILRAVLAACRCYRMPCRGLDYTALDPERHHPELLTLAALGAVDPEDFLQDLHAQADPDDDFLAAGLDPEQRRRRTPSH